MDTFAGRVQAGFTKFASGTSIAALIVGILGYLQLWNSGAFELTSKAGLVTPTLRMHDTWRYGSPDGQKKENARFKFDLESDLTPLFNWNTKQVFAYVTVDYQTVSPKTGASTENSVTIWDKLILDEKDAVLNLRGQMSKYSVWDLQKKFGGADREVQLNLRWNVQPHVGFLTNGMTEIDGGHVKLSEPKAPKTRKPADDTPNN